MGLVSRVVPDDSLMETVMELATRLAQGPAQALSLIKYLVVQGLETNFEESHNIAHVALEQARRTEDHKEAVRAFLEKRRPNFTGR
jgi:2-(1,2-epoxy-1,2-dihydrophenyl)acetyl-CoA isomerase